MLKRLLRLFRRRPLTSEELDALAEDMKPAQSEPVIHAELLSTKASTTYSRLGKRS